VRYLVSWRYPWLSVPVRPAAQAVPRMPIVAGDLRWMGLRTVYHARNQFGL
jgi:hypothetical protein